MVKRKAAGTQKDSKRPMKKPKATSLKNPPKRRITAEKKNIDTAAIGSFVAAQTTATLTLLNGVDDGATSITRIGRRITMDSLTWRFRINMATASTGASPIRNLIVYDKQANAAAPAILDVVSVNQISTMMNLNNSKRFIVLLDEIYDGIGTQGPQSLQRKGWIKLNLETEFNDASTATITSINTGSVYLIQWQDGGILTANPVDFFYSRIRFTDM